MVDALTTVASSLGHVDIEVWQDTEDPTDHKYSGHRVELSEEYHDSKGRTNGRGVTGISMSEIECNRMVVS